MSTFTAQILIGTAHPYHDGINPTHYILLSENSKPALILVPESVSLEPRSEMAMRKFVWIPTLENMLDDALLMIAMYVVKDRKIRTIINKHATQKDNNPMFMYDVFSADVRDELYDTVRKMEAFPKLILSIWGGSTLISSLHHLDWYKLDVEVCTLCYSRTTSWKGQTVVKGELPQFKSH